MTDAALKKRIAELEEANEALRTVPFGASTEQLETLCMVLALQYDSALHEAVARALRRLLAERKAGRNRD